MSQRSARGFGVACGGEDKSEIQLSGAEDERGDFIPPPGAADGLPEPPGADFNMMKCPVSN
jgi:hypothetical protein